jgi:heptaprenyl diphosphate synthase
MFMLTDKRSEKIVLFTMAFFLAGIERFIPVIPVLPWLKIGLFHAIVMVWIYRFGIFDALAFVFIRQWVIMSFFGFSFLPFLLGTSGTIASVLLGGLLIRSKKFGVVSLGVFSAIIHNITQLFVLYFVMSGNFVWQWQLPIMFVVSLFTGTLTGFLAYKINKITLNFAAERDFENHEKIEKKRNSFGIILLLLVIVATVIFENYIFYISLLLLILIISRPSFPGFFKSYGIFLFALYLSSFSLLSVLKISIWFLLTPFFQSFGFYRLFYAALLKIFPQKFSQTLSIGAIMPQIFPKILQEIPLLVKSVFENPKNTVNILLRKSQKVLADWR